jgi:hypothetical protein
LPQPLLLGSLGVRLYNLLYKFQLVFRYWCITTADYDKYVTKYKAEKDELEYQLVEYTNNDKSFVLTAGHLLRLAQKAQTIFQSSQPAQKNKILKTLLANCQIDQKRLQLNLLKPFGSIISNAKSQNWLPTIEEVINTIKQDVSGIIVFY